MSTYSTNEFKPGLKILLDGDPCSIIENEFVKPGKGQAFNRVKYRNLKNSRVGEKTFKSGDTVDGADVVDASMQYLYSDGDLWYFMNLDTFEQIAADKQAMTEAIQWLKSEDMCTVTLWNNVPLLVTAQNFVVLKVIETEPGVKGDTVSGGSKPAKLETGASIKVPLFVQIGDLLKIDTRSGEYVSRAK